MDSEMRNVMDTLARLRLRTDDGDVDDVLASAQEDLKEIEHDRRDFDEYEEHENPQEIAVDRFEP